MPNMKVHIRFPEDKIKEPVIYQIGHEFKVVTNVRRADVYVRPARSRAWPLVFLDDVPLRLAHRIVAKHGALAIETSSAGGCHIWLRTAWPLDEAGRKQAQRWLSIRVGSDPASTSGEHLGRLPGFRNWKRGGPWVNLVAAHNGKVETSGGRKATAVRERKADALPSGCAPDLLDPTGVFVDERLDGHA